MAIEEGSLCTHKILLGQLNIMISTNYSASGQISARQWKLLSTRGITNAQTIDPYSEEVAMGSKQTWILV